MTTRSSGKTKTGGSGTQKISGKASSKKTAGASAKKPSGTTGKTPAKRTTGKTTGKSAAKATAAGRKTSRKPAASSGGKSRKKKVSRKKSSLFGGLRLYLLGLILALTIGVVGTSVVLYFPETAGSLVSSVLLAATGDRENGDVNKTSHDGDVPDATNRPRIIYEEQNRLERRIKNLDRVIYVALGNMNVPEDDVNILEVDPKRQDHQEWDHALIEVTIPKGSDTSKVLEGLIKALAEDEKASKPGITVKKKKSTLLAEIRIGGLHTHTLSFPNAGANRRLAEKPKKGVQPKPVTSSANHKTAKPKEPNRQNPVQTARLEPTPSVGKPKVAIVIDDFGINTTQARCFLDLGLPITFSVLPFLPHSQTVANMAHDEGREVMLHMPMQPTGPENPGKGVLLVSMDRETVEAKVRAAWQAVPFVVGMNNHMGSRFTRDKARMTWVLEEVKQKGGFFLDSRTSSRSVGYTVAKDLGLPAFRRSIFLDNVQDRQAIRIQLRKLVARAGKYGQAIGIGHVYPTTCQALKSEYEYLASHVDLVPITELIR